MKKWLWIGSYLDEETNRIMTGIGYDNAASYVSQKNLLEGIEKTAACTFDTLSAVSMPGWPGDSSLWLKSRSFSHCEGARDVLTGYLNIRYINKYFMKKAMLRGAKNWLRERYAGEGDVEIFVYEMRSACLCAAAYLKKKIPSARVHLIVPDLPCYMDLAPGRIKRLLKRIDMRGMLRLFPYVDDYLLYAGTMAERLGLDNKKYTVMEGSVNENDIAAITAAAGQRAGDAKGRTVLLYSGRVDKNYGIDRLAAAMDILGDGYELWVTGGGPYVKELEKLSREKKNIRCFGFLDSREELFALQGQASVLLNIRDPGAEAAHYCFPSKLFEYMLFGVPVVSVRLRGIPDEYGRYLYGLDELTPECIAKTAAAAAEDPGSAEKAAEGRKFIAERKNNFVQAEKILEFIG